jgi:predicted Zn-dependent peptidase
VASSVSATAGLTGEAYESRDPDAFVLTAMHRPGAGGEPALRAAVDAELHRLATDGPSDDELADARIRSLVARHRRLGRLKDLAQALGAAEILHGTAQLPLEVTGRIAGGDGADVARAAAALERAHRAVLHVETGADGGAR